MKTYIVLLRGVMPVGKNRVPMARLREVLAKAGFQNVRTYIASGNVLVETGFSADAVAARVRALIRKHIGPDLVVVARTGAQLQQMLDANPFARGYDLARVFFISFETPPPARAVKELMSQDFSPEKLAVKGRSAWAYIPGPYVKGRLAANQLEKQLGISATMRNFNTMTKLVQLSKEDHGRS